MKAATMQGDATFAATAHDRRTWSDSIKDQIFSWHFSSFDLDTVTNGNPLITVTIALLDVHELLDGWRVDRATVERFLLQVESEYKGTNMKDRKDNPYHNNIHAADVTQTTAIILRSLSKHLVADLPKMELFCIIMASAVHDLGHLGVNNDFLINSKHPRATTYNDKSVNESYHISRAFKIARSTPGCDIFESFDFQEQKKARKLMIDAVMATDMAIHFDLLKSFEAQLAARPDLNTWEDRNLLYQMVIHIADIANPSRPFPLAKDWAERVIQEFCEQGDLEKENNLPISPFCVRETMNMPKAQLGFIDLFVQPTLRMFSIVTPEFANMALEYLDVTIAEWRALEAELRSASAHVAASRKECSGISGTYIHTDLHGATSFQISTAKQNSPSAATHHRSGKVAAAAAAATAAVPAAAVEPQSNRQHR